MELLFIEGGRFLMGSDARERGLEKAFPLSVNAQYFGNAEYPAHVTWITKPYWIGKTEVTVGQWRAFVEATGYVTTAVKSGIGMIGWSPTPEDTPLYQSHDFERKPEFNWKNPGFQQEENHPVVGVSWDDVQAFLKWLSEKEGAAYRLPTEAEWEFACRAGTDSWFSFGDTPGEIVHQHANLGNVELEKHREHSVERQWLLDWDSAPSDGHLFTAPVGSFEANALGVHDMHGNVWEWCQDLWLDTYYKQFDWPQRGEPRLSAVDPVNESEPQTDANQFRTIRGGSWYNGPVICRSSNRAGWDAPDAAAYIGFRVVREATPGTPAPAKDALAREVEALKGIEEAGGSFSSSRGLDLVVKFEEEGFLKALSYLKDLPELTSVIFAHKTSPPWQQSDLEQLSEAKSIRELSFDGPVVSETPLDFSALAALPELESLRFSRVQNVNDRTLKAISRLKTLKRLELYGAGDRVTDEGIALLASNRELTHLKLYEVDAAGVFLPSIKHAPLVELAVTGRSQSETYLKNENAEFISQFPTLTHLSLNQQSQVGDSTLLALSSLGNLEELNLHGCSGISPNGFAPLGKLVRLRSLNLQDTVASDAAIRELSSIPRIEILRIGNESITDDGLAALSSLVSLNTLYIGNSAATDAGLEHLGRLNRLRTLDIGSPHFTGSGLVPISKLPQLNDIRLRSPQLTNVVFEIMSRAKSVRKLRLVERGWQPPSALTNEGILSIAPATWLTELWLPRNDTGITEAGIEKLKSLMPKTGVIPYTVNWDKAEPAGKK